MTLSINASKYLSRHQCKRIFAAGAFAYCSGHPFNQFVSIHLNLAEVEASQAFISRFLKLFGDWLRRNAKHQAYWLWVLENPPYSEEGAGGLNAHILIHVPPKLIVAFRHVARKWIRLAGGKQKKHVLTFRDVRFSKLVGRTEFYLRHGLLGLLRYFSKGIAPGAAPDFGVKPKYRGIIFGKRCGYSEALGEQHRWLPVRSPTAPWAIGLDSLRRRFAKAVCPPLFEFPPYEESD